ncbi:MAG TPA: hypothetical protein VIF82_16520 [Burkholderiaceae bacterium]|jgi:hypothetical protein
MKQSRFGIRLGRALGRIFRPITILFGWWRQFNVAGATYFVMPDSMAIFMVLLAPVTIFPWIYLQSIQVTIFAILISPFALLSVTKIKNDGVVHIRFLFFVPYWFTRIPRGSRFELYEAWEDPAPSGVAFELPHKSGEYLYLGTATTAVNLAAAMSTALISHGWDVPLYEQTVITRPDA